MGEECGEMRDGGAEVVKVKGGDGKREGRRGD
jgi:hypothetical protein